MKITDVKTVLLTGPCSNDPYILGSRRLRSAALIEIHTDSQHVGIGETYAGYFCPELVPVAVEYFKPILVGADLLETGIHTLRQRMAFCENFWARVGLGAIILTGTDFSLSTARTTRSLRGINIVAKYFDASSISSLLLTSSSNRPELAKC